MKKYFFKSNKYQKYQKQQISEGNKLSDKSSQASSYAGQNDISNIY